MSDFYFSRSVFKRLGLRTRKNQSLFSKGLTSAFNSMIEWCFTPLSTVFQSYHGDSSHYSCLSWVSPVLGWGSEVSCSRILPRKNPEDPVPLEPRTPGLRVKHFTTEPRRTPILIQVTGDTGLLDREKCLNEWCFAAFNIISAISRDQLIRSCIFRVLPVLGCKFESNTISDRMV